MTERARFCAGCPRVPKGVVAEVAQVELLDRKKLKERGLSMTREGKHLLLRQKGLDNVNSGFGAIETLIACVETVAVKGTTNRDVEVGQEGELYILAGAITGREIETKIAECPEPITKLLGAKVCSAISADDVIPRG